MADKQKQKQAIPSVSISKWYKADDEPVPLRRKRLAPKPQKLRRNITPGSILILLSGRFRGKRVVFLKQLKSGLLLVTGPFKINGVPLKRVNSAYVIPTKTKVDLAGVNVNDVTDAKFGKDKVKKAKKSETGFFATDPSQKTPEQQQAADERKKQASLLQNQVDKALIANIKKVDLLKKYLSSRFSISNNVVVHDLVF